MKTTSSKFVLVLLTGIVPLIACEDMPKAEVLKDIKPGRKVKTITTIEYQRFDNLGTNNCPPRHIWKSLQRFDTAGVMVEEIQYMHISDTVRTITTREVQENGNMKLTRFGRSRFTDSLYLQHYRIYSSNGNYLESYSYNEVNDHPSRVYSSFNSKNQMVERVHYYATDTTESERKNFYVYEYNEFDSLSEFTGFNLDNEPTYKQIILYDSLKNKIKEVQNYLKSGERRTISYSYYPGRKALKTRGHTHNGEFVTRFEYKYDQRWNLIEERIYEDRNDSTLLSSMNTYKYDSLNKRTEHIRQFGNGDPSALKWYEYDEWGNVLKERHYSFGCCITDMAGRKRDIVGKGEIVYQYEFY